MATRVLILGNSGSGKSTLGQRLETKFGLKRLDLDTIIWVPGAIAEQRANDDVTRDLRDFGTQHSDWVIEGCYGEWIEFLSPMASHLVFLNPGVEACLANNRRRPHEPHKYASLDAQNAMFEALQDWVRSYPEREDAWSLRHHQRVFEAFRGSKWAITDGQTEPVLDALAQGRAADSGDVRP